VPVRCSVCASTRFSHLPHRYCRCRFCCGCSIAFPSLYKQPTLFRLSSHSHCAASCVTGHLYSIPSHHDVSGQARFTPTINHGLKWSASKPPATYLATPTNHLSRGSAPQLLLSTSFRPGLVIPAIPHHCSLRQSLRQRRHNPTSPFLASQRT
jgi:hypothetical protein